LLIRSCAEIAPSTIEWLWEPYLARGRLAVLDGDFGSGKSLVAVDLAARLSRGEPLPNGQRLERPHTVLLLSAEDPADIVRPRLAAAGAKLDNIGIVGSDAGKVAQLPDCVPDLKLLVKMSRADLLVLDPLSAFVPRASGASEDKLQRALAPLRTVAADASCAVLLVRGATKSVGPSAVYRGGGAAVLGSALTGMLLARHPCEPGLSVLALTKAHLGQRPPALGFRFRAPPTEPPLEWTGRVDLSADELCVPRSGELVRGPRERAEEFLRMVLGDGARPVEEVEKLATEQGVSWRMVLRVKSEIGVSAERARGQAFGWVWRLRGRDRLDAEPGIGFSERASILAQSREGGADPVPSTTAALAPD
jgi:hypothetical protein